MEATFSPSGIASATGSASSKAYKTQKSANRQINESANHKISKSANQQICKPRNIINKSAGQTGLRLALRFLLIVCLRIRTGVSFFHSLQNPKIRKSKSMNQQITKSANQQISKPRNIINKSAGQTGLRRALRSLLIFCSRRSLSLQGKLKLTTHEWLKTVTNFLTWNVNLNNAVPD